MKVTILGSGGALGIPVIGCKCKACTSNSPMNKRLRASALVTIDDKNYLIDAGPDYRSVALSYGIDHLSGVFLTHYHADHVGGLNDLRPYNYLDDGAKVPLYASESTYDVVQMAFAYLVERFDITVLTKKRGEVDLPHGKVEYFAFSQSNVPVLGYRFGDFAYITDIKEYDESIFVTLEGVKVLVISAPDRQPSRMHIALSEAIEIAGQVGAEKTYLTHLSHKLEHDEITKELPDGFELAYDGLEIYV